MKDFCVVGLLCFLAVLPIGSMHEDLARTQLLFLWYMKGKTWLPPLGFERLKLCNANFSH